MPDASRRVAGIKMEWGSAHGFCSEMQQGSAKGTAAACQGSGLQVPSDKERVKCLCSSARVHTHPQDQASAKRVVRPPLLVPLVLLG